MPAVRPTARGGTLSSEAGYYPTTRNGASALLHRASIARRRSGRGVPQRLGFRAPDADRPGGSPAAIRGRRQPTALMVALAVALASVVLGSVLIVLIARYAPEPGALPDDRAEDARPALGGRQLEDSLRPADRTARSRAAASCHQGRRYRANPAILKTS